MFVRCSNSSSRHFRDSTPKHTQKVIDATQKEIAIDHQQQQQEQEQEQQQQQQQQQHCCEPLICQRHQTILRFLSTIVTAGTRY
jgi:hypothetical protein